MQRPMELKTLRSELRKLSAFVDAWNAPDDIPEIERDLVLEKLRALYDAVRFAGGESVGQSASGVPEHVNIDLAVPFSIEPMPAEELVPAGDAAADRDPEMQDVSEPVGEADFRPASEILSESRPEEPDGAVSGYEPERATAPEVFSVEETPQMPEPHQAEESVPSLSEVCEAPEVSGSAGLPDQTVRDSGSPTASEVPAAVTSAENPASKPVMPTLFGVEEENVRHRHKQRVIMSLYGVETTDSDVKSARPEKSAAEFAGTVHAPNPVTSSVAAEMRTTSPVSAESSVSVESGAAVEPTVGDAVSIPLAETVPVLSPVESEKSEGGEDFTVEEFPASAETVLGEVINHDVRTLADTIVPQRDMVSELVGSEPVSDLRRAIGINDKFLLIRDLFGGDGAAYESALEALNGFDNLDDCMIYIAENYAWNPRSDGAKFLMKLLERKFA